MTICIILFVISVACWVHIWLSLKKAGIDSDGIIERQRTPMYQQNRFLKNVLDKYKKGE